MIEMVERVARAMCVVKAVDDDQWELYAKEARAAIEAMQPWLDKVKMGDIDDSEQSQEEPLDRRSAEMIGRRGFITA